MLSSGCVCRAEAYCDRGLLLTTLDMLAGYTHAKCDGVAEESAVGKRKGDGHEARAITKTLAGMTGLARLVCAGGVLSAARRALSLAAW